MTDSGNERELEVQADKRREKVTCATEMERKGDRCERRRETETGRKSKRCDRGERQKQRKSDRFDRGMEGRGGETWQV